MSSSVRTARFRQHFQTFDGHPDEFLGEDSGVQSDDGACGLELALDMSINKPRNPARLASMRMWLAVGAKCSNFDVHSRKEGPSWRCRDRQFVGLGDVEPCRLAIHTGSVGRWYCVFLHSADFERLAACGEDAFQHRAYGLHLRVFSVLLNSMNRDCPQAPRRVALNRGRWARLRAGMSSSVYGDRVAVVGNRVSPSLSPPPRAMNHQRVIACTAGHGLFAGHDRFATGAAKAELPLDRDFRCHLFSPRPGRPSLSGAYQFVNILAQDVDAVSPQEGGGNLNRKRLQVGSS